MDLNASPQAEEDDEPLIRRDRTESAVEIARREREERRKKMRLDRPIRNSQPIFRDQNRRDTARVYDKIKIPQGWLDCPGFGLEIGYIIPSKVPLSESYNEHVPPGKRYSFKQVVRNQRINGRKLGLVIDLTNTTRYYPTLDLKKDGIRHVKIACKGRDSVPDNVSVNTFVNEVNQFIFSQKHTKTYILVHCTHGHNRTGFMIVHYLMRSMLSMNVTQALKMFYDARPPGIYKADYIDALYTFYHEIKPENVTCPPTPEWKKSSELDLNGEAVQDDDDDDNAPPGPVQEINQGNMKMSNDDILGHEIPHLQEEAYRQFCYKMLMMNTGGRGCTQFPGSHPVSLDRESLQLLRQRYYYATWKADGTRYMMLLTIDGCYLIDRNFRFRRVQMRFPCKHPSNGVYDKVHHYTLLDGEMVIDNPNEENGQGSRRRYLVYDLVAINGESFVERTFCERWNMVVHEVIKPRDDEKHKSHICYRYELEPFGVRIKGFWLLSTVEKLLKVTIPSLSHEADGLIFQGWDDPYVPRTHKGLLKWKYAEMNSVDFLFETSEEEEGRRREMLFLYERGKKKLMEGYSVEFRDGSDPSSYSGKIVECSWDKEKKLWVSMRIRVDKSTPNDINTARKVIKSIDDNITEEVLLQEIREIIRLPMYADRIQSDLRAAASAARRR